MKKIVFVSRLDDDCSLGAYALCEIAPRLAKKYADLQIIIVGGGTEYKKIGDMANQINSLCGRKTVRAVGWVTEPRQYFDGDALFVGVSRAALEAMSCGLPIILLGNEGYMGLLDEKKLPLAEKTNFTGRGTFKRKELLEIAPILFDEICRYFSLSEYDKQELSFLSYQTVKRGYTSRQMAEKTLELYERTVKEHQKSQIISTPDTKKVVICGYYGHKNLGDEAILYVIKKKIKEIYPLASVRVLRGKSLLKNAIALYDCDLFIFGGGSLLQNCTSNASLFFYIATIFISRALSVRTVMLSNGIGPIEERGISRAVLLKLVAKAVDTFDFISVRDEYSRELLKELLPERSISLICDPAWLFLPQACKKPKKAFARNTFLYVPCCNSIRKKRLSPQYIASALKKVESTYGISPVFAVLNPSEDLGVAQEIAALLQNAKIVGVDTPHSLFSLLDSAAFVISQRYHGALFSAMKGVPVLPVSDDPKMRGLCRELGIFSCQNTEIFKSAEAVTEKINALLKDYERRTSALFSKISEMTEKTDETLKKILQKHRK